jgi:glycerol-3-phosphate acyltransferase PlsY
VSIIASAALILLGYLAGAIPWGVILGRIFVDTDLRQHGSGGTGTTNAYRILGWRISVAVLVLDFLKGLLPVLLAIQVGGDWTAAAVAVATVVGHCWSPFIKFDGGKGVATGSGAATALLPAVLLVLPIMIAEVIRWRYVSLASLTGSVLAGIGSIVAAAFGRLDWPTAMSIAVIAAIIVVQHRSNIQRLRSGNERRLIWPPGRASGPQAGTRSG